MSKAKPFIKWVGGKSQLIEKIGENLPADFVRCSVYVEPFVGGGAVMFHVLQNYKNIKRAIVNDINHELILTYNIVKNDSKTLIKRLSRIEDEFYNLENSEQREEYFLEKREMFNQKNSDAITTSSLFIFLNKTCFNGLYRVNSKGLFNVPYGKYIKPVICDTATLLADSELLQRVEILEGDFSQTVKYASKDTLFYCDPPYKPISETSTFNSYAKGGFCDNEQERLKKFCDEVSLNGAMFLQSNSSPEDGFFDSLYNEYRIEKVLASRMVNSVGAKRGKITELLISNYQNINQPQLSLF
ncbi:Methyl-directed repair DNA adenine methylase [Mucinivorans hirudinis]|uniref:site-specific DNA-methyltransferase (adenine-specific) n=1 Tax=Mucinivorans hirudinis TaxID=1433126 RepID=A0A060R9Z7_9BACT|nr:Methyl-directed repair DNA adenine methylase [Mucinivorans hirudinis]